MKHPLNRGLGLAIVLIASFTPLIAFASVESSLLGLKTLLLSGILPILAAIALGWAAFQFSLGNPNAKTQLIYALVGTVILFLAQTLVDLIGRIVG